jgi:hypothetical protein
MDIFRAVETGLDSRFCWCGLAGVIDAWLGFSETEVIYGESFGGPNSDNGEIAPGECVSSDETLVILLAAIDSPADDA